MSAQQFLPIFNKKFTVSQKLKYLNTALFHRSYKAIQVKRDHTMT